MINQNTGFQWIETYTGKKFNYKNPDLENINIIDIAHSLSQLCRFNGHCHKFYSVAEHSYWVAEAVRQQTYELNLVKAALLHDAVEAYIGDYPSPFKSFIPKIKKFEKTLHVLIMKRFDIPDFIYMDKLISEIDLRILINERRDVMNISENDWGINHLRSLKGIHIKGWNPSLARRKFLKMWEEIEGGKL